jgi:putative ABC transport system permease protein
MGSAPEDLIGRPLTQVGSGPGPNRTGPVIGVFRDAHFASLHEAVRPLVIGMLPQHSYIPVRIAEGRTENALEVLKEKWTAFEPGYPFSYYFMDDDYGRFYEQDERLGSIFAYFSGLAVLIACLGLFGLASFVTVQRTREIGLRKVMGATAPSIVSLLSLEFTKLVLVACIVAFHVGWFAMNAWLRDFAYRIDIGPAVFILSGALAVAIAWLTVGYLSIRAALANPIVALRHE